jgi:6-phosphofructokinase 1
VQVVEVMGRHAGHLALWSGVAGGAQMILIPECPFSVERVLKLLEDRLNRGAGDRRYPRYAVVVVSEGATPSGGQEITVDQQTDAFGHARLGGIGAWLAEQIRTRSKFDARAVALGHPQRGGPPSPVDRVMGLLFGTAAIEAVVRGEWGKMVSARGIAPACDLSLVPLAEAVKALNLVDVTRHYDAERYFVARRVLA